MSEEMNLLLKHMMNKMNKLQEQVDNLQSQQESSGISSSGGMETEEVEQGPDGLVDVASFPVGSFFSSYGQ